jgi:signal transduction histidine kinase
LVKQAELSAANASLARNVSELDRLHSRLDLILRNVPSGVIAMDRDGRIDAANPAAAVLHDGPLLGRRRDDVADDGVLARVLAGAERVAEERLARVAGRQRRLRTACSPLRDAEGSIVGAVEVWEDITEIQELQQRLQQGERLRALGEMAAGAAHEIRNPLTGIAGFASLLERDLPPEGGQRRYAAAIVEGVRHLERVVGSLLTFTRTRAPDCRETRLGPLLREVLDVVGSELEHRRGLTALRRGDSSDADADRATVSVALELAPLAEGLTARCDATQIRQVVLNLVLNAVQACQETERPGRVLLAAVISDGRLQLTVDDDGPGVPSADRERIFAPFFTTKDQGTGLGLAVCSQIAALHAGRLSVADSPLGGARFLLDLPA